MIPSNYFVKEVNSCEVRYFAMDEEHVADLSCKRRDAAKVRFGRAAARGAKAAAARAQRRRAESAAGAAARAERANAPVAREVRGAGRRGGRGGAAAARAPDRAPPARGRKRARSGEDPDSSGGETDISVGVGGEEGASDGEAGAGEALAGEAGAGEAMAGEGGRGAVAGAALVARVYRRKPLATDLHVLLPLRACTYGCGAMLYPEEKTVCCSGGKYILGPLFNPDIDAAYLAFLQQPHVSSNSRLLNTALATGTQGVFPTKAMGGAGFVSHHYGYVFLMGKRTYLVMHDVNSNNAFDNFLMPDNLLLDAASEQRGPGQGLWRAPAACAQLPG